MSTFAPIPGYATTRRTVVQGTGAEVAKGDTVTVHAKGTVAETSKVFWSTKDPGQKPFTYDAGVGGVMAPPRRERMSSLWSWSSYWLRGRTRRGCPPQGGRRGRVGGC